MTVSRFALKSELQQGQGEKRLHDKLNNKPTKTLSCLHFTALGFRTEKDFQANQVLTVRQAELHSDHSTVSIQLASNNNRNDQDNASSK